MFRRQTEQEEIFLARFLRHLDRRAIMRSDCQGSIHHELHVAGAAGLITGSRYLVGDITRGDQTFG